MLKVKIVFTIVMVALMISSKAAIDFSAYQLKDNQIKILKDFEAKGKYSDEWLHKLALAMQKNNKREAYRQNMYIPSYTQEELTETLKWARGGAFAAYADLAGYQFLGELYRADCPNVGLFRFGRATGTEFIPVDVMRDAINTSHQLQTLYAKLENKESYGEIFYELATEYGLDKYLRKVDGKLETKADK